MPDLLTFLGFEIWTFIIVLTLLVIYQLLTGKINTDGLLYETTADGQRVYSPTQLQALIVSVGGAVYYLFIVLKKGNETFPDIPEWLLLILGGSHLVYLGDRLLTLLAEKFSSARSRG